jgi:hypothetical protein
VTSASICQTLSARTPVNFLLAFLLCAYAGEICSQVSLINSFVDRVFVHALNTVKRIPRTGSARPPSSARLKLYGLYKQSMEGDVEGVMSRPPPGRGTDEEKW